MIGWILSFTVERGCINDITCRRAQRGGGVDRLLYPAHLCAILYALVV